MTTDTKEMYDHKKSSCISVTKHSTTGRYVIGNGHEFFTLIINKYASESMKILPVQPIV
jgi:hypothetical protein